MDCIEKVKKKTKKTKFFKVKYKLVKIKFLSWKTKS